MEWIWSSQRNWRPPNSTEFHGTARVSENGALQVPWNSMKSLFYLKELFVSPIMIVLILDRIQWNLSLPILMTIIFNFAGWIIAIGLYGPFVFSYVFSTNLCFIINICIIPHAFPTFLTTYQNIIQNLFSMLIESYFDQIVPWNFLLSSMGLFEQHLWLHRIPWNLSNKTSSSRELKQQNLKFHGIPCNLVQIQSSMEFYGTFSLLPNSMEFHWIPWNF